MDTVKAYEDFPFSLLLLSILVTLSIYSVGAAILSPLGFIAPTLYLLFCLGCEINVMRNSCVDCYYYGRRCAFGRGKLAPLFFKQGDPARFASKTMSWKDLLPDMLAVLIPLAGGIAVLLLDFTWTTAMLLALLLGLAFGGNYYVRSNIACKFCKQRELGCPAEQFFGKK